MLLVKGTLAVYGMLTGDARPRFFDELCSRSGADAREAMTVGYKPTNGMGRYKRYR